MAETDAPAPLRQEREARVLAEIRARPAAPPLPAPPVMSALIAGLGLIVAACLGSRVDAFAALPAAVAGPIMLVVVLVSAYAVGAGLGGTSLTLAAWPRAVIPMMLGASFVLAGPAPAVAAGAAFAAAAFTGIMAVGLLRSPLLVFGVWAMLVAAVSITDLIGNPSGSVIGVDAPRPPLWTLMPLSDRTYTGILINFLLVVAMAMLGTISVSFRIARTAAERARLAVALIGGLAAFVHPAVPAVAGMAFAISSWPNYRPRTELEGR